jgi:phage gp36-like protein
MPYVTRAEIETAIAPIHLIAALDDDGDGAEDTGLFDSVVAMASVEIDGLLAGRYSVPFTGTIPAVVRQAAFLFVGEAIYARRQLTDKNPFAKRATEMRERLGKIGAGEMTLDIAQEASITPGALVTQTPAIDDSLR